MATSMYAPRASAYRPIVNQTAVNPIGFNNSTDARKATANQRQLIQGQGDVLQQQAGDLANQYREQAGGVEDYLHTAYDPMAAGQGGYNAEESAAINLSPAEKQNIVTGAGISSGVGTAASVAASERAAAAAGGNPMALATYRARAAQSQASNAGDAMTKARVEAKQVGSQGAQTTGAARLGQQDKALGYYGQLQGQKNQNSQNEQALQQGAFGTTVGGTNAATGDVLKASQTPSKTDKIIGGISGAAKGLLSLADGTDGYLDGTDAVVGEDGPEAIIEAKPAGRSYAPKMMAEGGRLSKDGVPMYSSDTGTATPEYPNQGSGESGQKMPFGQRAQGILQNYLAQNKQQPTGAPQPAEQWNPTTPYKQLGDAIGSIAGKGMSMMLSKKADAGMAADGLSLQSDGPEDNGYGPVGGYLLDSSGDGYLQDSPDGVMAMADGGQAANGQSTTPVASGYRTALEPKQENEFQSWVKSEKVPWKDTPDADYDMRGYYQALRSGDPSARQAGNKHFPDTYKTPFHATFSNESKYSTPDAPHWEGNRLIANDGHVVADESGAASTIQKPGNKYGRPVQAERYDDVPSSPQYGRTGISGPPREGMQEDKFSAGRQIASEEKAMANSAGRERAFRSGDPAPGGLPLSGFKDKGWATMSHDEMQRHAERAMSMRKGYTNRYKADGQAPTPPKIVTSPTRVRLAPGDAVVPLTYRPHAKVRPSAFVNAYQGA